MNLGDAMRKVYTEAATPARKVHVQVGRRFRHFKGRFYVVVGFAREHSTGDRLVLYRRIDEVDLEPWSRPLSDFVADVDHEGRRVPRFREATFEIRGNVTPEQWREAGSPDRWPTDEPTICSVCKQPQYMTVSGVTCPNHHGGASGEPAKCS